MPSINIEDNSWKISFRASLDYEASVESEAFRAEFSLLKFSLLTDFLIPFSKKKIKPTSSAMQSDTENIKINKKKGNTSDYWIFLQQYTINIVGSVLDLKLYEDAINSSLYFKIKSFLESFITGNNNTIKSSDYERLRDPKKNINKGHTSGILSIKFDEILLSKNNEKQPFCVFMSASFVLHKIQQKIKDNKENYDTDKFSNRESMSHFFGENFDFNCNQVQLYMNTNDDNVITISEVSLLYVHSKGEKLNPKKHDNNGNNGKNLLHVGLQNSVNISCKKVDVDITEIFLDLFLEKTSLRTVKYFRNIHIYFFARNIHRILQTDMQKIFSVIAIIIVFFWI